MECNDRNKRKFQCGKKESSACTEYAGWLPKWSELLYDDCVTVEEVLEEQYHVLDNILNAINVSDLGRGCIDYPVPSEKRTVAMVLAAFEDIICTKGARSRVYVNDPYTASATKADIPSGFIGTSVDYTVDEGSHVSAVSQDDANYLAVNDAHGHAQEYANKFGSYSAKIFYNSEVSKEFEKNDCVGGVPCGVVEYKVKAGDYTSTVSQEEADSFALEDIKRNGQSYANAVGKCKKVYLSTYISKVFYKNDCGEGYGDAVGYEYNLPSGAVVSEISQYDADSKALDRAMKEGQALANKTGVCSKVYYNDEVEGYFEKNDCGVGYRGKSKIYSIAAGTCSSFESKEAANLDAMKLLMEKGESSIRLEGECVEKYWPLRSVVYPSGTALIEHPDSVRDGEYAEFNIDVNDDFIVDRVTVNGKAMDYYGRSFTVFGDRDIVVKVYTKTDVKYHVSVKCEPDGGGSVVLLSGDGPYISGSPCLIRANPNNGYGFEGWYRNGVLVSLSKNHAFNVDRNTDGEYVAVFYKE